MNNQGERNEKDESEWGKAPLHAELLEKVAHIYCLALSTGKTITTLQASTIDSIAPSRRLEAGDAPQNGSK